MPSSTHSKKNMLKTFAYIAAILLSLCIAVFILFSSKEKSPVSIAVVFGIWGLFFLFCLFKIQSSSLPKNKHLKGALEPCELDGIDGIAFEELACELLLENDFELAENTQPTCDYGVDILAQRDGMTYAIQCKCYTTPVGIEAVQQVYAGRAFYECHVAVVLTNQTFTANAQILADKLGVVLWDREMLRRFLL